MYTELLSQALARVGALLPGAIATGSGTANWTGTGTSSIDITKGRRILFATDVGSLGASGTLTARVLTATSTATAGFSAVTAYDAAITATGCYEVEFTNEGFLGLGGTTKPLYVVGCLSVATNAISASMAAWQAVGRNEPISASNLSTVTIVTTI